MEGQGVGTYRVAFAGGESFDAGAGQDVVGDGHAPGFFRPSSRNTFTTRKHSTTERIRNMIWVAS